MPMHAVNWYTQDMDTQQPSTPRKIADRFYTAFAKRDGDTMANCYAPNCEFSDPVFVGLVGDEVRDMWRMLTTRAQDFSLEYTILDADDRTAHVSWVARYRVSTTGKQVINHVRTSMEFENGLIKRQKDTFDLYQWASQALGIAGKLFGWTSLVQNRIRKQARQGLAQWRPISPQKPEQ